MLRVACTLAIPLACSCGGAADAPRVDLETAALDLDGAVVRPFASGAGVAATLLVFVREDCPIANRCAPALQRLHEDFAPRGVRVLLVYADPAATPAGVAAHRAEYALTLPAVLDPRHALVRATGATVTPEAALVLPDGTLAYRGRVDDRWTSFQDARPLPTREDLREALEDVLAGRPVRAPRAAAVGCYLEDVAP